LLRGGVLGVAVIAWVSREDRQTLHHHSQSSIRLFSDLLIPIILVKSAEFATTEHVILLFLSDICTNLWAGAVMYFIPVNTKIETGHLGIGLFFLV
jgi:hypothetical protein